MQPYSQWIFYFLCSSDSFCSQMLCGDWPCTDPERSTQFTIIDFISYLCILVEDQNFSGCLHGIVIPLLFWAMDDGPTQIVEHQGDEVEVSSHGDFLFLLERPRIHDSQREITNLCRIQTSGSS